MTISRANIGKLIKYKPPKVKDKIKVSKSFPRFKNGGLSYTKLTKKIRSNKIA
mgnify:FL=1|jgi:hypothetical protein|tara:strand:+ start:518 stop:676 length:159 start_codon:yes stop_codon:yes gene_type:complete